MEWYILLMVFVFAFLGYVILRLLNHVAVTDHRLYEIEKLLKSLCDDADAILEQPSNGTARSDAA